MLRSQLDEALKTAMKAKDTPTVGALRLILAALKDRDIAARGKGNSDGISDDEILSLLQSMIKQRRESVELYKQGGRLELAHAEEVEIAVIETFLPEQMSDQALSDAIDQVIEEVEATSLKDMGQTMALLKQKYAGQMDSAKASSLVKQKLA